MKKRLSFFLKWIVPAGIMGAALVIFLYGYPLLALPIWIYLAAMSIASAQYSYHDRIPQPGIIDFPLCLMMTFGIMQVFQWLLGPLYSMWTLTACWLGTLATVPLAYRLISKDEERRLLKAAAHKQLKDGY